MRLGTHYTYSKNITTHFIFLSVLKTNLIRLQINDQIDI